MALPARNRETLQFACEGKIVVTIDMREPCLLLYPLPDWEVVQGKLEGLSNINPQARMLQTVADRARHRFRIGRKWSSFDSPLCSVNTQS